jgi:SNF family Na+-dependent transporter
MGLLAAFTIEVVYAVVVGWVLWYLFKALTTGFANVDAASAEAQFSAVLSDNLGMLLWTLVGLAITGAIIYAGVKNGIERAVSIMMPLMFALLVDWPATTSLPAALPRPWSGCSRRISARSPLPPCSPRSVRRSSPSASAWAA